MTRRFLVLLLVLPAPALAQMEGRIVGTVTEHESGRPLAGVVLTVSDPGVTAVTGEDGFYFLNRVPPGERTVSASLLGYATRTRVLRVLTGHTATVDFALARVPIEAEEVVVVVEGEPLLVRDLTASRARFTGEEAARLPVESVDEVVSLSPGVYRGQDGFIIRGGRGSESATYVDGALTTGFASQRDLLEVGSFAVEQIDVVTGTFGAQLGHAQSGVIQMVTRAGGSDFHGKARFTTDGRFGTNGLDARELEAMDREPCCGHHSLQLALSGPLIPGRVTLSGSLEATGAADIDPRAGGFNPTVGRANSAGSTGGILPGNRGDRTRIHLKSTARLPRVGNLSGTLLFSRDQEERHFPAFGLGQHRGGNALRTRSWDAILSFDRVLHRSGAAETSLRVLGHLHRSETRTGVPRSREVAALLREQLGDACGAECDVSDGAFDADFLNFRLGDIRFFFEDSLPGTVPLLVFGRSRGPDPVFGVPRVFFDTGIGHTFSRAVERRGTLRVDLDSQLGRAHRLAVGSEWTWIDLSRRSGWLHIGAFADLYEVTPLVGAVYAQHRWDRGDFVLDLGLRWDHWDPRTVFPTIPGLLPCEMAFSNSSCALDARTASARTRNALSPRLAVAHPVSDRTHVRVSFGRFRQLPELQHYFRGHRIHSRRGLFGNPQLDYIRTTSLEAGITQLLSEDTVLDLVAYNRDRVGAIRTEWVQAGSIHPHQRDLTVFINGDNGNVKGLDLTLTRRWRPHLSADLGWSLQWARGTTSSPLEWAQTFGFLPDPLDPSRLLLPPTELQPDSYDRLHAVDARVSLDLPPDFGGERRMVRLLENVRATFVYRARSGTPFTRIDPEDGFPLGDLGSDRNPWTHEGNLRLVKGLPLGAGTELDLFLLVLNVFGEKNILRLHPTTGVVNLDGSEFEESRQPFIPRAFLLEGVPDVFPLALSGVRPEYRDALGRQDRDGDGVISLAEAQTSLLEALVALRGDSPFSYGAPRQVRFGVEIRF